MHDRPYTPNHIMAISWASNKANEFRKHTEPVHINDMQETRCFLRDTRNGVDSFPYFSMTSGGGIDARESTLSTTYIPRRDRFRKAE